MAALSHWEMGLYPFTLNLLRLFNCFNNRLWWVQTLETSNFYFLTLGMETSNVYFLSLGMLVLEEASCHVTGLAVLRVPCLWEFQAPWRGPTGWDVMWRKSQAKGHWGTDKGKSFLGVDAFAPAASRTPLGSEVNHPPVSFLSSWPTKSWAIEDWYFKAASFSLVCYTEINTWNNILQEVVHILFPWTVIVLFWGQDSD